jgi:hypothetical protein
MMSSEKGSMINKQLTMSNENGPMFNKKMNDEQ